MNRSSSLLFVDSIVCILVFAVGVVRIRNNGIHFYYEHGRSIAIVVDRVRVPLDVSSTQYRLRSEYFVGGYLLPSPSLLYPYPVYASTLPDNENGGVDVRGERIYFRSGDELMNDVLMTIQEIVREIVLEWEIILIGRVPVVLGLARDFVLRVFVLDAGFFDWTNDDVVDGVLQNRCDGVASCVERRLMILHGYSYGDDGEIVVCSMYDLNDDCQSHLSGERN